MKRKGEIKQYQQAQMIEQGTSNQEGERPTWSIRSNVHNTYINKRKQSEPIKFNTKP